MFSIYETGVGAPTRMGAPSVVNRVSPAEKLYRDLQVHRANDAAAWAQAEGIRELAAAPITRFVLDIVEDGQSKQLDLVDSLLASLRDALYWTHSPRALPDPGSDRERAATVEALQKLVEVEKASARSAKRLAKGYSRINGRLERAILEASAARSNANVQLLRLVVERLERGGSVPPQFNTTWDAALRQRKLAANAARGDAA